MDSPASAPVPKGMAAHMAAISIKDVATEAPAHREKPYMLPVDDGSTIVLTFDDGVKLTVNRRDALYFPTIRHTIESGGEEEVHISSGSAVLRNIRTTCNAKVYIAVFEYGRKCIETVRPAPDKDAVPVGATAAENIPDWSRAYFKEMSIKDMLAMAGEFNYLGAELALDDVSRLLAGRVAASCAGLATRQERVERIRKDFGIVGDFTPEEEAELAKVDKFCEEN
jgi:hypothetical protein